MDEDEDDDDDDFDLDDDDDGQFDDVSHTTLLFLPLPDHNLPCLPFVFPS